MKKPFKLPRLGMRNIKTALCVLVCLTINFLFENQVVLISSIAAIVCIQSTLENTLYVGLTRLIGTAIGGGFAILLIPLSSSPSFEVLYIILAPIFIVVIIYLCNVLRIPGSSPICAIVFISVIITPLTAVSVNLYYAAFINIVNTAIGIVVAMLINRFIAPPKRSNPLSVEFECNTFDNIYDRISHRLTGNEQLILYDSHLTSCELKKKSPQLPKDAPCIRIPVPTEYSSDKKIRAVHIDKNFIITPTDFKIVDSHIAISPVFFPCTVVWHKKNENSTEKKTIKKITKLISK